jgi:hypothetical protein
MPKAIEDSYSVWYAAMVIRISSRTRSNSKPRSAQLIVTWRINSSKHCAYSSSRTGHMPVSRACRCSRRWSSCSCKLITSSRVAGVLETYCTHSWPSSVHSLRSAGSAEISAQQTGSAARQGKRLAARGRGAAAQAHVRH